MCEDVLKALCFHEPIETFYGHILVRYLPTYLLHILPKKLVLIQNLINLIHFQNIRAARLIILGAVLKDLLV